jgi:hypothetical protein
MKKLNSSIVVIVCGTNPGPSSALFPERIRRPFTCPDSNCSEGRFCKNVPSVTGKNAHLDNAGVSTCFLWNFLHSRHVSKFTAPKTSSNGKLWTSPLTYWPNFPLPATYALAFWRETVSFFCKHSKIVELTVLRA